MPPKPIPKPAKPNAALRAAVKNRKKGDLELLVEKLVRGDLSAAQWVGLAVVGVAVAAGVVGVQMVFGSKARALSPSDNAGLKEAFFSGEPWLVECTSGKASPLLREAEGKLPKYIKTATLDCDGKLQSGKTTIERFKLKPPARPPFLMLAANLEKPAVAQPDALTSADVLARWATATSKPRLVAVTTAALFESACLRRRWCALAVTASGRISTAERKVLTSLSAALRSVRFASVDLARFELALDLPGGVPQPSESRVTLLLLKSNDKSNDKSKEAEPSVAATLLESGLSDEAATLAAVRAVLDSTEETPATFTRLLKRPSVTLKQPPPSPPRQYDSSSYSSSTDATKTLTDDELRAMRAERAAQAEALEKEREQQRREEMAAEEEQAGNLVEEEDDLEGDAADADEDVMEEEEVEAMEM